MILTQIPKFHTPQTLHFFKTPKPKTLITSILTTPNSPQCPPLLTIPDETHLQLPLETLFIPPDADVSSISDPDSIGGPRILKVSNIVLSWYASDAEVKVAEFVKSSVSAKQCPDDGLPEFALVGRSNVGKSSLFNSLVRRKKLALTSKKPGKTQCINHFRINDSWYLVDLPGFGLLGFNFSCFYAESIP